MNNQFNTLNWTHIKAFLATAELGSLSAAAKALNSSQPTIGRQISALEDELQIALFERSGRGPEITPSGLELLQHVRDMQESANRFAMSAAGKSAALKGSVAITATQVSAAHLLPPMIQKLQNSEPEIEIELIAENSTSDLKRREADIALRGYRPTQEDLITRKVMDSSAGLYASINYLNSIGGIETIADLKPAKFIGFDRDTTFWAALNALNLDIELSQFSLFAENHLVQWELVKQGLGIGVMANDVGEMEPIVERVLPDQIEFPYELWLTAHRELRTNLRIRRVFDFLAEEIALLDSQHQAQ